MGLHGLEAGLTSSMRVPGSFKGTRRAGLPPSRHPTFSAEPVAETPRSGLLSSWAAAQSRAHVLAPTCQPDTSLSPISAADSLVAPGKLPCLSEVCG